jgi:nitrate/nitrite transporter NarK
MQENPKAIAVLTMNTIAFTVCFACWMLNGVLVTFLVENQVFRWSESEVGWLIGIPVLSGALFRLPVGILTDKYGGKWVYMGVMLLASLPMFLLSYADSYWTFFFCSLGFGLAGTAFAVGIAYTSVWFRSEHHGTALGIFGAGNAGAALTSMGAPFAPRMRIESPGKGVMAKRGGTVTHVSEDRIVAGGVEYPLRSATGKELTQEQKRDNLLVLPKFSMWQEPVVAVGDEVEKKQLLARGVTRIFFQANVWIFTGLVFIVGVMMGIGKAAVYKHIPDYFPQEVGVVGGIVGVLGGLGGFVCPIIFGYLLEFTGIWTTCWMFFTVLSAVCLWGMHRVIQRMLHGAAPQLAGRIEPAGEMPQTRGIN